MFLFKNIEKLLRIFIMMKMLSTGKFSLGNSLKKVDYKCHKPPFHIWMCSKQEFFCEKSSMVFSSTYWPLSLCKIFKKKFNVDPSYGNAPFLGPKWPICPNNIFFWKFINKPCCFHSCLTTFQKSKSGINLLMEYWRIKNTETPLTERHFWP